jgi:hypothetical protein
MMMYEEQGGMKKESMEAKPNLDKANAVKKVKDYNQVRNEVMEGGNQKMENVSQVVSNLRKTLPKMKAKKK